MRINTNVASLNSMEASSQVNKNLSSALEKLSSGLKINKASDDASGLAIADKLRTQASSIKQSIANGNSAVSLLQIADKAMAEQSNILDIVKTKLIQAATATTSTAGRYAIAKDVKKLLDQLDNVAKQTNYNGIYLLQKSQASSSATSGLTFQMGELSINTMQTAGSVQANTSGLGIHGASGLFGAVSAASAAPVSDLSSVNTNFSAGIARTLMKDVDTALNKLNGWRADFGSTQNQVESAIRNMMTQHTNIKAAESVIRDVDYAEESANFNKQNIIAQAGTYAMSQANQVQQNVLRLLQ